ncbi:NAD(P)-binding protein [Hypoxylon fragiforme]|uniref:NAD(P)-binding protein n=1 Tax=Hypoxylon fragiforme TaxID=63214 RepID=UPI0020C71C77|nr:NAD(P)-binding protein [Hypoxylon fragiforme]KAI2611590.1 NAD(P)-binding protein [Hypoxylon fragiforme]
MSAIFQKANTAVITGGASGIGLALAHKCVGYGMRVVVADWDTGRLDEARRSLGAGATALRVDVAKTEDWAALKTHVVRELGGQVNLLALNAGVSGGGTSFNNSEGEGSGVQGLETWRKVVDVNFFGVVNGITTFLPLIREMVEKKEEGKEGEEARIIITGSKQGITNPPGNPAYNASKAAVRSVAEQLSFDLRAVKGVAVHLLIPGWTWTPLAGAVGGKAKPEAAWTAEQVVEFLEGKMREGEEKGDEKKFWVLCPDNDVSEETDRKRMLWTADDPVKGRLPLSRWRDEYNLEFEAWMKGRGGL